MQLNINKKNKSDKSSRYDAVIIGGGPAGLTSAIYLSRARFKTLLIEEMIPGGQAATSDRLENYPGFPEGIAGPKLGSLMEEQAKRFDTEIIYDSVKSIVTEKDKKSVILPKREIEADTIIIASGAKPRKLNVPGADKFDGKGISYCATCDGALFKDKDIVIIGGGNSAVEEGLFLLRFVKSITFIQDLPDLTAEAILKERIGEKENVKLTFNNKVISINGEDSIESVTVKKTDTGEEKTVPAEGVFIYIGYTPNTEFLPETIELDKGYIKTDDKLKTNIDGIYAAGDVRVKTLRQVATAVGDGALAGFNAIKYLENIKEVNNG